MGRAIRRIETPLSQYNGQYIADRGTDITAKESEKAPACMTDASKNCYSMGSDDSLRFSAMSGRCRPPRLADVKARRIPDTARRVDVGN